MLHGKNNFLTLCITIFAIIFFISPQTGLAQDSDLEQQIKQKQNDIEAIKKKMSTYQENIRAKQEEAASLRNQVSVLENKIAKTGLDIKASETEIAKTQLETRNIELQILAKEDSLVKQKFQLSNLLQNLHRNDLKNELHVLLLNNSISDFFNQVEYTKELQAGLSDSLDKIKIEKANLANKKIELDNKHQTFLQLKADLEIQRQELDGEVIYKDTLLVQTKNSEKKFSELYNKAKQEQEAASAEITALEKKMRGRLGSGATKQLTFTDLAWPVPKGTITATFHDPGYPFRYLFEHPAIDIRTPQRTAIKAPADGYVLTANDAGMGYSYVALIHGEGLSTVYGHVNKILVEEGDFVPTGTTIALSGGMPGTPGAGRLSTGPHLHFEVRLNGIPVNPLDYLP